MEPEAARDEFALDGRYPLVLAAVAAPVVLAVCALCLLRRAPEAPRAERPLSAAFVSAEAKAAREAYAQARAKVNADFSAALRAAQAQYAAALDQALKKAAATGDRDEAGRIAAEKNRVEAQAVAANVDRGPPLPNETIDLLPLVQLPACAVAGQWRKENNELACGASEAARVRIPYEPPEEYDFYIEFTPLELQDGVEQILARDGARFAWRLGAARNETVGFGLVGGRPAQDNPTTVWRSPALGKGRRHSSLVEVRADGISAYLDGALAARWVPGDGPLGGDAKLNLGADVLGVGAWNTAAVFHAIRVKEVKGRGLVIQVKPVATAAAPPPPAPAPPAAPSPAPSPALDVF